MNIYFAYTIGAPDVIYYGKYYGYTSDVSDECVFDAIAPSLQQCYSIESVRDITISILARYSTDAFSDRDLIKYEFIYRNTVPVEIYLNGTRMK